MALVQEVCEGIAEEKVKSVARIGYEKLMAAEPINPLAFEGAPPGYPAGLLKRLQMQE